MIVKITKSVAAIRQLRKLDSLAKTEELAQVLAKRVDDLNEKTSQVIRQKLSVSGRSRRGRKESRSGDYLYPHYITGVLRRSIGHSQAILMREGNSVSVLSSIGSGAASGGRSVKYAAIQEYGGTIHIPSRDRKPRNKKSKYLKSNPNTPASWLGKTKAYTITIPARSYLRSTIKERKPVYNRELSLAVVGFIKGK